MNGENAVAASCISYVLINPKRRLLRVNNQYPKFMKMETLMKPADEKQEGSDINYNLGKRIKTARKSLGLSQTHIAAALGVSFQQVGKYESGQNTMSVPTFLTICRALRLRPSSLLDEYLGREKS